MGNISTPVYLSGCVRETLKAYGLSALLSCGILVIVPFFVNCVLLYYVGGLLFLTTVLAPAVIKWIPRERITPDGKAVFISGCDTGFGHMLARRLDDLGFHVFAGCLFPEGDGATKLRKTASNRLHVIGLDVTNDSSVEEAVTYVKNSLKDNVLWAVVNNAGINAGGELLWTDMETIRRILEVNTFGIIRLTKAFIPQLKESQGRVVTVASAAGRSTWPGMVPYCMSKTAAIAFCDGLRLEMYKWDIPVVTIEPWMYKTPILSEERVIKNLRDTWESAPKDITDMYRSQYLDDYIKNSIAVIRNFTKPDPGEVVSLLEDAIRILYPEYSLSIGTLASTFGFSMLEKLPKPLIDMFLFSSMMSKKSR